MDKIIDSQFSRVEKALSTLIQSIATYNPSPQLATDLVVADQELSQGLELREYFPFSARKVVVGLRSSSSSLIRVKQFSAVLIDAQYHNTSPITPGLKLSAAPPQPSTTRSNPPSPS